MKCEYCGCRRKANKKLFVSCDGNPIIHYCNEHYWGIKAFILGYWPYGEKAEYEKHKGEAKLLGFIKN